MAKLREAFDPSFAGIPFTGEDSAWGESDEESKIRFINENLPKYLADSGIFDNIFNVDILKTIEQKDFDKLKNDIATNLTTQFGYTITTDLVDQMIQLVLPPKE